MAYAKRTCHKCGMIKPVNYMEQKTIKKKTGSSSEKLTAGTMIGFLIENPSSKKRVQKRIFANNKRGYVRNKDVWQCKTGQCHRTVKQIGSNTSAPAQSQEPAPFTTDVLIGLIIMAVIGIGGFWLAIKMIGWILF